MLKLTDVKRHFIDQIIEKGLAKTKPQAEQLFVESLTRNLVSNEIMEMCQYIANKNTECSDS